MFEMPKRHFANNMIPGFVIPLFPFETIVIPFFPQNNAQHTHTSSLNPAANVWRSSVQFLACYQRVTSNYVFDISPIHCRSLHFTINYIDNFYTVEITNKTSWNKSFRFDTFFHRQNDNWDADVDAGDKEDAVNGSLFSQLCVKLIGSWILETDMLCSKHTLQETCLTLGLDYSKFKRMNGKKISQIDKHELNK